MMTVEKALQDMCYDTGKFGFCSDEDPFVVDGEDILEIYEQYLGQ